MNGAGGGGAGDGGSPGGPGAGGATRRVRIALGAAGSLAMAYGVGGALTDPDSRLPGQLLFLAGMLVGHDALLAPAVLAAGALVARWAPAGLRAPLQAALVIAAAIGAVAMPLAIGA